MSAVPTGLAVRTSVTRFTFAYVWGNTLPVFSTWMPTNGCRNQGKSLNCRYSMYTLPVILIV